MPETPQIPDQEMPFLSHLVELRDRLLRAVLTVLVIFLCLFSFANDLYELLARPLMTHLPEGSNMVAIDVASPFIAPLKLTFILSMYLAIPVILYQLWSFIAPGLYKHEKRLVLPLMISSSLLFYLGMLFAYFVVFPLVFSFFVGVLPTGVEMSTDIGRYLDFVLKMFFAFGIAFEVPVFTLLLIWTNFTTAASLREKRPYVIVGCFIVGMLLTPPDMFSQILLAVPMWLLFELGIIMSAFMLNHKPEDEDAPYPEDYHPLSEAEADAELERIEIQERAEDAAAQAKKD